MGLSEIVRLHSQGYIGRFTSLAYTRGSVDTLTPKIRMLYTKRVTLVFLFQFILTLSFVIYCLLIVTNFAEMFLANLAQLQRKREHDSWLQVRCTEQEFVHHIRHHIDLCEAVERDALSNSYLVAMQMALDGLHLCGSYSCERIIISLTESLRLSIYTWITTLLVSLVLLPLCVVPLYRKWQRNLLLHESRIQPVPSVYIRDHIGNMQDVPLTRLDSLTEPRNRRLIGNGDVQQYIPPTPWAAANTIADLSFFGNTNGSHYQQEPYHSHST